MLGKIKQKLKGPLEERMYQFLMREAPFHLGRKPFDAEELKLLTQALLSQNLFGVDGKMVSAFEKEFAKTYGIPYAVASTSGTAAIHTALGALELNPGDEVITAPITDLGTIVPILYQQCIPVFADVDETYNMDPQDIERKITSRTKAILVVHLFGNPCDMDAIMKVAKAHHLPVIEDCAQAHVTEYKGRYVGTIGDIGCFSFQQAKHMTTGDGGMTITSNKDYYEKMRLFVDKGYARKGWGSRAYLFLAPNYRMNELTAAVGLAQLKKVKGVVQKRNELGTYMSHLLIGLQGVVPAPVSKGAQSSYWMYPVYLKNVDTEAVASAMRKERISVLPGYTGKPIYLCSESLVAKKTFGSSQFPFNPKVTDKLYEYKDGLCPRAEDALKHLICILMDESWTKEMVEKTADILKESIKRVTGQAVPASVQPQRATVTENRQEKKIKIGIVGCGQMGRWHYRGYRKNPKVEIVGFADEQLTKAESFAQEAKCRAYRSHKELMDQEKLDGASVCTVPSSHHEIVVDLLNKGVNVLCEKPLAISLDQAEQMINIANQKNLLLLSAFKFRFFEEVQALKKLLEQGGFGKILNFRLMFGGYMDMQGSWYADKAISGGGIIMDNGPHAFDLIRYLFGEIESVSTSISNYQNISVEDTAQIMCFLKSGAKGVFDTSWSLAVPSQSYLEVYGEYGAAMLDLKGLNYKFKTWTDWKRIANQDGGDMQAIFSRQCAHFVDAIVTQNPTMTHNEDGLMAQMIIENAYALADLKCENRKANHVYSH